MPKALIYCRVSSERQVKEGHGLDGQERNCRRYAELKGYDVVEVFRDEGVSGGLIDRAGMERMLDFLDARDRAAEYVVLIDDIKRLARDLIGHFTLRKAIHARGARLESPSHKFGDEPEDVFVESIMAATAEYERNQNKRQVKNRMRARLEAGYWPFYQPPGYTFAKVPGHGKLLVRKEPDATVIREALEGFASGRLASKADVRRFLDARAFKPDARHTSQFREFVQRLLEREVYAGFVSYPPWNVTTRRGHHEPLISPETFERIRHRLRERAHAPQRTDADKDFPLRGFVLCADCRKPYTASWTRGRSGRYPYYRCKTEGCESSQKSVRADRLHAEFEALLAKLKPRDGLLEVVRRKLVDLWAEQKLDVETVRKRRQARIDALEKEIAGYLKAIDKCSSPLVLKRIEEQVQALEAQKVRLGGRIPKPRQGDYDFGTALDRVLGFVKDPLTMWRTGDLRQRRLVLRLVFTEPLVHDRESGFGTASFSLPIALACVPELDEMEVVDMVRKSWNRLEPLIRDGAALLAGLQTPVSPG
jgi:DNA invertase Pin-like site-specific DNA recombinase